jgi:RHS repeat-associated protein
VRYVRPDGTDALAARVSSAGVVAWYLVDRQGSVRALVNGSGSIIDQITYDAFGGVVSETNASVGDRYKYTGREYDTLVGLQYNRARWYDPATGRWISEDPTGFAAGDSNLDRYVGNGPTDGTDPTGHYLVTSVATKQQMRDYLTGENGLDIPDSDLNTVDLPGGNSVGFILRHSEQENLSERIKPQVNRHSYPSALYFALTSGINFVVAANRASAWQVTLTPGELQELHDSTAEAGWEFPDGSWIREQMKELQAQNEAIGQERARRDGLAFIEWHFDAIDDAYQRSQVRFTFGSNWRDGLVSTGDLAAYAREKPSPSADAAVAALDLQDGTFNLPGRPDVLTREQVQAEINRLNPIVARGQAVVEQIQRLENLAHALHEDSGWVYKPIPRSDKVYSDSNTFGDWALKNKDNLNKFASDTFGVDADSFLKAVSAIRRLGNELALSPAKFEEIFRALVNNGKSVADNLLRGAGLALKKFGETADQKALNYAFSWLFGAAGDAGKRVQDLLKALPRELTTESVLGWVKQVALKLSHADDITEAFVEEEVKKAIKGTGIGVDEVMKQANTLLDVVSGKVDVEKLLGDQWNKLSDTFQGQVKGLVESAIHGLIAKAVSLADPTGIASVLSFVASGLSFIADNGDKLGGGDQAGLRHHRHDFEIDAGEGSRIPGEDGGPVGAAAAGRGCEVGGPGSGEPATEGGGLPERVGSPRPDPQTDPGER